MKGFNLQEIGIEKQKHHWLRGCFPLSFLARTNEDSFIWRKSFIQTVIERDFPQLGLRIPSTTMYRFWAMLAHFMVIYGMLLNPLVH